MPTACDEAICIRHWDWSETSQTVCLLTRSHGVIRGLAKGSRREKSRFSGGFEVLTRGQALFIAKPGSELATLTEWDLAEVFPGLRRGLRCFYAGMYLADLLLHSIRDHDPHPGAFDAALHCLRTLGTPPTPTVPPSTTTTPTDEPLARVQWALLGELGYRPELARDVRTGADLAGADRYVFAPHLGGLTADPGGSAAPAWPVRAGTVECLRGLGEGGLSPVAADPGTWERAARLLAAYFREVLGQSVPSLDLVFPASTLPRPARSS